jgi:PKD domain-containing protein/List-Bact-rpt repeat protein
MLVGVGGAGALGTALILFGGTGYPATRPHLHSGTAWLVSTKVGQLTLLDGSSAELAAQVTVADPGTALDVVQQGPNAYAVNDVTGSIRRVDGATFAVTPPSVPIPDAHDGLRAYASPDVLYALDTRRGVLRAADPRTLAPRSEPLPLAAQPAAQAATIDGAGRLWLLDGATGDLIWIDHGQRHTRRGASAPGAGTLVIAGGAPVLVDTSRRTAEVLDPDNGQTRRSIDLDLRPDDRIQAGGSPDSPRLYLVAARGVLQVCDLTGDGCPTVVPLAGDLGPPIESGRRVFVPDYSTGQVWIVDLDGSRVVGQPKVLDPHVKFQLLNRDGVVFFNDPDSEHAGVIRLDGGVKPIAKYDPKSLHPGGTPGTLPPPSKSPKKPPTTQGPKTPTPTPTGTPTEQPARVRIAVSTGQIHVGEDVTFAAVTDGGPAPVAGQWDLGDGGKGNGTSVKYKYTAEGNYLVTVTATLADGRIAVASETFPVTVRPPVSGTVTVTIVGGGAGTVTSSPPGISCPGSCAADFGIGVTVHLTVTFNVFDTNFTGWGGPCTPVGTATSCDVPVIAGNTMVPVKMAPQPVLTLTESGPGDVSDVHEFSCRQNTCKSVIIAGSTWDLTAVPDAGAKFVGWGGACASFGTQATCSVTMDSDKKVTVTFASAGPLPAPVQESPPDHFTVPRTKRLEMVDQPVTWDAVAGADHYIVQSQEISFITGKPISDKSGTTTQLVFTVTVDCTFPTEGPFEQWRVTAVASDGTVGTPSPWRHLDC